MMRVLLTEQWVKHRRFVAASLLGVTALVAAVYAATTAMVLEQVAVVRGLEGMTPGGEVQALAADLLVLTPGMAPDQGLALVFGTVAGTVLMALAGARLAASEFGWRTTAGFVVRHGRRRAALGMALAAVLYVLLVALVTVVVAWVCAVVACQVVGGSVPAFAPFVWREPSANVVALVGGATLARLLDVGLAFLLAAATRSGLVAFAGTLAASVGQLALVGQVAWASWLPSVTQVSVWPTLLRYSESGGLLYAPLGATGAPLALTLALTVGTAAALLAASSILSVRREYRA